MSDYIRDTVEISGMTKYLVILGVMMVIAIVCGCTQPASPVQPTTTMSVNAQTSAYPTATTMPVPQSTNRVNDNTIRIGKDGFDPVSITVKPGSIVRWVNADSTEDAALYNPTHRISIVSVKDSPLLSPGMGWSWIFDEPGSYSYNDMLHPIFEGTVIVK
jgi:plastocyanin